MTKAIVLLSGGIDSTVILAKALSEGKKCLALSFDYGQRHRVELEAAASVAAFYHVPQKTIAIDPSAFAKTSLLSGEVPKYSSMEETKAEKIPSTQVPARNTLFLAYALGQAEIHGSDEIHIGPNAQDFIPYPDCRPVFYEAFQKMANYATKQAVEGKAPTIVTPLIYLEKKEIVELGKALKAPLELTFSCYDPTLDSKPCNHCLACHVRNNAFSNV